MGSTFLEHGLFIAPYHDIDESPTIALRRDLELVQWADRLGFKEAWFGEHHSKASRTRSRVGRKKRPPTPPAKG